MKSKTEPNDKILAAHRVLQSPANSRPKSWSVTETVSQVCQVREREKKRERRVREEGRRETETKQES